MGRIYGCAGILALVVGAIFLQTGGIAKANDQGVDTGPSSTAIHLAMLFNNRERDKAVESGKIDYVWGADSGWAMKNAPAAGVQHAWYSFFTMDTQDNSNHDLAWFQQQHPDWIEYACDRTTPVHGHGWVAFDISTPAVQQYLEGYITQAMAGGYNGIDFDETDTFNENHVCGHYDARGHWIGQYNGQLADPAYRAAIIAAFGAVSDEIRQAAAARGIAFSIAINPVFDPYEPLAQTEDLFPFVDLVLDEDGVTGGGYSAWNRLTALPMGNSNNAWLTKMSWYRDLLAMGKGLIINAEEPYQVTASQPPPVSDVNWVLANYLLIKNDATYQGLITGYQQYGGPYDPVPAYQAPIGTPTDAMHQNQGIWMREYSGGLALVNPSPTVSATVTLPPGQFTDLAGAAVGSTVTLPAGGSGLVLLRSR